MGSGAAFFIRARRVGFHTARGGRYIGRLVHRILLLITDLEIGGTPTVVRELATRLSRARADVHVEVACLAHWGPVATQLRDAGVTVHAFGARSPFEIINVVKKLSRLVRERHCDTVFSFLIHANTVAAFASRLGTGGGVRFIQSIQTTQPRPRWHWWLQRLVHHAAERVVVPSPSAATVAHERADVPREKIVVIPNAIAPADFGGMGVSPVRGPLEGQMSAANIAGRDAHATFHVGFVGRLDPVKRIPDLLAAIAALDERFKLHVFGEGAEREHIKSVTDRYGITRRVKLHGAVAKPRAALEQIDLLVLPSQAEGFGLVLIEAMASGVPVVATDVAGICDVVRDGETGLLVPVATPPALARAIRRIADDDALRRTLVEHALADVRQRFTWDVVLPQYEALLCAQPAAQPEARKPVEAFT